MGQARLDLFAKLRIFCTRLVENRLAFGRAAVDDLLKYPVIPAIKSLIADKTGDHEWRRARPPLLAMTEADHAALIGAHAAIFTDQAA